jgi:hypothetical protein
MLRTPDAIFYHFLGSLKRQSSQGTGESKEYPSELLKGLRLALPA